MFDDLGSLTNLNLWGEDEPSVEFTKPESGFITTEGDVVEKPPVTPSNAGKLEQEDAEQAFFDEVSDIKMPRTKPENASDAHPQIVVIDDDFSTLDLMKIYLQRTYDFQPFDNAREAIFYLNKHVPHLIFLDCYISIIAAKRMVEIIRSYREFANVPIYLLAEADEVGAMEAKIQKQDFPDVQGILTRPVARGELQVVLDAVFPAEATT